MSTLTLMKMVSSLDSPWSLQGSIKRQGTPCRCWPPLHVRHRLPMRTNSSLNVSSPAPCLSSSWYLCVNMDFRIFGIELRFARSEPLPSLFVHHDGYPSSSRFEVGSCPGHPRLAVFAFIDGLFQLDRADDEASSVLKRQSAPSVLRIATARSGVAHGSTLPVSLDTIVNGPECLVRGAFSCEGQVLPHRIASNVANGLQGTSIHLL